MPFNPDEHTSTRDSIRERQESREDERAEAEQEYDAMVKGMEKRIAALEEERDTWITTAKTWEIAHVAARTTIKELRQELADRDEMVAELDAALVEQARHASDLRAMLAAVAERLDETQAALASAIGLRRTRGESEN